MKKNENKHIVFIHGAWHGSWCFAKMRVLLEHYGYQVTLINLPGHGVDFSNLAGQISLKDYVDRAKEAISFINEPVTVVAHSMGGIVLSMLCGDKEVGNLIEKGIYLSAFMVPKGKAMRHYSEIDTESIVYQNLFPIPERGLMSIRYSMCYEMFYHKCCDIDINIAIELLTDNPIKPMVTNLFWDNDTIFNNTRKFYIKTTQDKAITPSIQQMMIDDNNIYIEEKYTLNTDHSSFWSKPKTLVGLIRWINKK
jgi:hypothetical protein